MNRRFYSCCAVLCLLLCPGNSTTRAQSGPELPPSAVEPPAATTPPAVLPQTAARGSELIGAPTSQTQGTWIPLGPAPTVNAQVTIPPSNQVSGAIQAIAVNPTNANILYIGAVNGGIWRTTNAYASAPTWVSLTDSLASLNIGSLELDPTDPASKTIITGSGRFSSFGAVGGALVGVLYSTNDGASWATLGSALFANENLSSVAARGNILMAASDSQWSGGNGSGLFRSTNSGANFVQVSGAGGTGLPSGPVSDLVGDPGNPARLFAAVRTVGIFRSDDFGATWTNVTSGISGITGSTTKIEMAAHSNGGTNALFAGIINANVLAGVYRSTNLGASWTAMDVPVTHNGSQGQIHFCIASDRTNANIVYIGGDRIATSPFTGNLFRGDASLPSGSQFVTIMNSGGGNTAPHADSREMVMDAVGNLIESDDGGVYRRTSPMSSSGVWSSVIGNLAVIEAHDVAYDSVAKIAMVGTQDNGTHIATTNGSPLWTFISGGDGGDVAIDDRSTPGQSVRYGSSQNLGGFYRYTYNAANQQISSAFPALTLLNGSPAISVQFTTPIELNKVDPRRLIIGGGNYPYESTNQGNTVQALTNGGTSVNGTFSGKPIAYGGWLAGAPNLDVLYYGSGTAVRYRTNAGGTLVPTGAAFPGGTVVDLVLDTNDWRRVFVISSSSAYVSTNSGSSWVNITGNLTGVGNLRSTEFMNITGADGVVVGTDQGVYISYLTDLGNWQKLGDGMPNAPVYDLAFNPVDQVLVAGTMGRGAWLYDTLSITNPLIIAGTAAVVAESCLASNSLVDPGEIVTVTLELVNTGTGSTSNLIATLLATNGILLPSGPQSYGVIASGGGTATNSFSFRADGPCGGTINARLQLSDGARNLGVVTFPFVLGGSNSCCIDPLAADVSVSLTVSPSPVLVGSNLTFTLAVSNNGPAAATGVIVSNNLPAGTTFVGATPSQGTAMQSGTNIVADLGTLAPGGFATIAVVVTPGSTGLVSTVARVLAAEFDYNSANNSAAAAASAVLPVLSINNTSVTEGNSGNTNAVFTVTLSPAYGSPVTVNYSTSSGTATSGSDFVAANGLLTFAPGITNLALPVAVIGDLLNEADETFNVTLATPTNATLSQPQGVGTILNDDPLPFLILTNASVIEGNTGTNNVSLTVRLSAVSGRAVTVLMTTSNGTATAASGDYAARSTNLTIAAGSTSANVTFPVFGDVLIESNETFFVNYSSPTNALLTNTQSTITIVNDDGFPGQLDRFAFNAIASTQTAFVPFSITLTALDASNNPVTSYNGPAVLNATRLGTVHYSNSFEGGLGGFTINNSFGSGGGLWHLSTGRGFDAGHSPSNSLYYGTGEGLAGGGNYNTGNNEGVATSPAINLSNAVGTVTLTFNYLLQTEVNSSYDFALVEISTNNGATFVTNANANLGGVLTNDTGLQWRQASLDLSAYIGREIRLRFHFDTVDNVANAYEGWYVDDIVITSSGAPVAMSPAGTGLFTNGVWSGEVTLLNAAASVQLRAGDGGGHTNASAPFTVLATNVITIDNPSVVEGDGGFTPLTFNLRLAQASAQTVSVQFATASGSAVAGTDFLATNGTVTFSPGQTNKTVVVQVLGDTLSEVDETFSLVLSNPAFGVLADTAGIGTILNDDPLLPLGDSPRNGFPVVNGTVNAVIEHNGVVYFGGTFTEVSARLSGRMVPFALSNGFAVTGPMRFDTNSSLAPALVSPLGTWPQVDRTVNVIITDGAGGWYAGGDFTTVGGLARHRLVHLLPDRTVDGGFNADFNAPVLALDLEGTNLLVAGSFTSVTNNGTATNRLRFAVLDAATGAPRSLASNPAFNNSINALAAGSNIAYVGGAFTTITNGGVGTTRQRLAAIDLTSGQPTAFIANADNTVNALALGSNSVYAGGTFTTINSQPRSRVGEVDRATGTTTAWSPALNSTVSALLLSSNRLYAGGSFTTVTNSATAFARTNLAALDTSTGDPTAWAPNPNNSSVVALALADNQVVAGGSFTSIGGLSDARRLAVLDPNTGLAAPLFDPDPSATVNAVAYQDGIVYAGGTFSFFKGQLRNRLAAANAETGELLLWNPNASSNVLAMAAQGTNIYVGGAFTTIGGVSRGRIAAVDPAGNVITNFNPSTLGNTVRTLVAGPAQLYVGGDFSNVISTVLYQGVIALNLSNGAPNTAFTPNPVPVGGSNVLAMALEGTNLYLGGTFTNVAGQNRLRVVCLNASNGAVSTTWSPQLPTNVLALAASSNAVYVGGLFTSLTNTSGASVVRNRLAAIDQATGDATGWNPNASGAVTALELRGTNLLAGGAFTNIGGFSRARLAELATGSDTNQALPWNPAPQAEVLALQADGYRVYAGGSFTGIGSQALTGLAVFEPNFPPELLLSPATATFTEDGPAITVAPGIALVDLNDATLAGATVTIVSNYTAGVDILSLTNATAGIAAVFSPGSGVLTLSGTASVAAYQAALRAITFTNNSDTPVTAPRVLRFVASDAFADGNPLDLTLNVIPVNDRPTITIIPPQGTIQNQATKPIAFTIGDPDNAVGSLTVFGNAANTNLVPAGNYFFTGTGSNRTVVVLPGTNQWGSTLVAIYVSDGLRSNQTTFTFNVLADTDGDGLPDDWENLYGLNPSNPADAGLDTDGDGLSNLQEYLAGTNPLDPTNYLGIVAITLAGDNAQITFPSIAGRIYQIESIDNLGSGVWTIVTNGVNGTGSPLIITDPGAAAGPARDYRVRVLP